MWCSRSLGRDSQARRTRNRRLMLVKMDISFVLKLNTQTLSAGLPETSRTSVHEHAAATSAKR